MPLRQHAAMQDASNENAIFDFPVEDNMLALLDPSQASAEFIARAANRRMLRKPLATGANRAEIANRLAWAPGAKRIVADVKEVGFCAGR